MPKPFIRPLSVEYHDFLQKTYDQKLPNKFNQYEEDDYKQKRYIKRESYIRVQNNQPIKSQVKNTTCKLCSCLTFQMCQDCQNMLCQKCKNSCALKFTICDKCKQNLCYDCRNNLVGNKKIKLRNYKINLKRIKDLHFKDCQCQECQQHKQIKGSQNKSHLNVNSQIKKSY